MPALGKTNASRVKAGDRILVQVMEAGVTVSATKTGASVTVVRVTGKGEGRAVRGGRMTYAVHTTAGTLEDLAPIQTMWLAPEDAAGVKRAHVEALLEDKGRAMLVRATEPAPAPEVTGEAALAAIGGCWAGGALTGKALKAHSDGDYVLALALATDQKALQEAGGPDALHPEERAFRGRPEARTARVAREVLEVKVPTPAPSPERDLQLAAYAQVGPGVYVSPMGTPEPTPEDLSDLAVALAAEGREHLEPEEVRAPKDPALRCQPRDVVTIHRGTRLYLVERVEVDSSRSRLTGEVTDLTMALVSPVDPEDERAAQWVHVDLLHVRRPVARIQTVAGVTPRVRESREAFTWGGRPVIVRAIVVDSARLPVALLREIPNLFVAPVATLRAGEALVVDGRCYAVTEEGELEPAPHRDRLHQV